MDQRATDKTALSYWFPKLEAAGLPVPRTLFISMPKEAQAAIWAAFDGSDGAPDEIAALQAFLGELAGLVREVGLPAFLRTEHTSAKHSWKHSCYVTSDEPKQLGSHIFSIAEYSEINDMFGGLPWDRWVVREYLPIIPITTCPRYDDMPTCREYRFFVEGGEVRCWHPYWPLEALERGGGDLSVHDRLTAAPDDYETVFRLAHHAARAVDGAWSIDILETKRGWFVTDMAEAHKSFHWEGCEQARRALP